MVTRTFSSVNQYAVREQHAYVRECPLEYWCLEQQEWKTPVDDIDYQGLDSIITIRTYTLYRHPPSIRSRISTLRFSEDLVPPPLIGCDYIRGFEVFRTLDFIDASFASSIKDSYKFVIIEPLLTDLNVLKYKYQTPS